MNQPNPEQPGDEPGEQADAGHRADTGDRAEPSASAPTDGTASAGAIGGTPEEADRTEPLDLVDVSAQHKRRRSGMAGALLVAAAIGGVTGLIGGRGPGLITAAVVGLFLIFVVWVQFRRRVWLEGSVVAARAVGVRRVDLKRATRIELVVTSVRGVRSIGLVAAGPPSHSTVNVPLALYAGTGGREQGILLLRKLADTLAGNTDANGYVFSELLVAQLRAEARDEAAPDRPLYQLASLTPEGKLSQRLTMDAVSRFVANLD